MKLDQHSLLEGTKLVVLISYLPPTLVNRLRLLEGGKNQILCRLKGTDLDKGGRKCRCRSDERGGRGEELRSQPCSGGEVESELCRRRPEARPKAAPSKLPRKGPRHQQSAPPTWPRMGRTRRRGGRRTHRAWSERSCRRLRDTGTAWCHRHHCLWPRAGAPSAPLVAMIAAPPSPPCEGPAHIAAASCEGLGRSARRCGAPSHPTRLLGSRRLICHLCRARP